MQEKASSASFALLGRKYLQPSSHVPATVLASTCNRPRTYLQPSSHVLAGKDDNSPVFPADTRNSHSQAGGQKKDCVAIGTQSDMYV